MTSMTAALDLIRRYWARLPDFNWRMTAATMAAMGILHICATLAAPHMVTSTAYSRLAPLIPINELVVLPKLSPGAQPMPFLTPDVRYAMCRYDTNKGGVKIVANLPGRGWSLALHSPEGDNIYTALGQDDRSTLINLHLVPTGNRFSGLSSEALGIAARETQVQVVSTRRGIAVIRAPERGDAYEQMLAIELGKSTCAPDAQASN